MTPGDYAKLVGRAIRWAAWPALKLATALASGVWILLCVFLSRELLRSVGWQVIVSYPALEPALIAIAAFVFLFLGRLMVAPYVLYIQLQKRHARLSGLAQKIFEKESIFEQMSALYNRGCTIYQNHALNPAEYAAAFRSWEDQVADLIKQHFSVSDLHEFRTLGLGLGLTKRVEGTSGDWLSATETTRQFFSARLHALNHLVQYGSTSFFGPKEELRTFLKVTASCSSSTL
jgi:hypothetical protein